MGSADAGKDAALIYTVIENCKVHGIDPERYLVEVIEALRDPVAHGRAAELTPGAIAKAPELNEFFNHSPDRRHIRMDPHNNRESLADVWLQLKS